MNIDALIKDLTFEEKCQLLVGKNGWETKNIDRLEIPSIFMADGPHGLRKVVEGKTITERSVKAVCYPSLVTLASSFDPKVASLMGSSIAKEFKANDVSLILGPGVNIKRHPFCGRNFEYFSEDPLVSAEMGKAFVKGAKAEGVGVCAKHYALNSQESYRMMSDSVADVRAKYEIYYRSFAEIVSLEPEMIMCSYNKVDGVYASENIDLLKKTLRDEFGFQGVIVSDWSAVNHRSKALVATLDLEMPGYIYGIHTLLSDVKKGLVSIEALDASVKRILTLVNQFKDQENIAVDLSQHHQVAAEIAAESMVLLKNDEQMLPISKDEKILLLGEMADKVRYQGGGSSHINAHQVTSIVEALADLENIDYLQGYRSKDIEHDKDLLEEAAAACKDYDKVIIVCGLTDEYESEGYDREHLSMPENQIYLINKISKINPNVILLLEIGSPVVMPFLDSVKAVLNLYLGGEALGLAVRKVLLGEVNPSGRLAETFPLKESDIPSHDHFAKGNHKVYYKESIYVGYRYYQTVNKPVLFPFGYGLSYSQFDYRNLTVNQTSLTSKASKIKLSVDVTNVGNIDGKEVVLLFFEPIQPKTPRPKRELIAFDKVFVKASETVTVHFTVTAKNLQYYHPRQKAFVTDDGTYKLQICKNARDILVEQEIKVARGEAYTESVWNQLQSYQMKNGLTMTDQDFEVLIGKPMEPLHIKHSRPFTINNNLEDISDTWIGKKLRKALLKRVDDNIKDMPESFKTMVKKGIAQQPLRSLVLLSGGMVKMHQMEMLLALINRRFIKALIALFGKD